MSQINKQLIQSWNPLIQSWNPLLSVDIEFGFVIFSAHEVDIHLGKQWSNCRLQALEYVVF